MEVDVEEWYLSRILYPSSFPLRLASPWFLAYSSPSALLIYFISSMNLSLFGKAEKEKSSSLFADEDECGADDDEEDDEVYLISTPTPTSSKNCVITISFPSVYLFISSNYYNRRKMTPSGAHTLTFLPCHPFYHLYPPFVCNTIPHILHTTSLIEPDRREQHSGLLSPLLHHKRGVSFYHILLSVSYYYWYFL